MRAEGWHIDILAHARRGGRVLGICGGYQMLGQTVSDPQGIEGPAGSSPGLGLLDVQTTLTASKTLREVKGRLCSNGAAFSGFEMHVGETTGPSTTSPFLRFDDGDPDGAISPNGRIAGAYVHRLFDRTDTRRRAPRRLWC